MQGPLVDNVTRSGICMKTTVFVTQARSPAFIIDGRLKTFLQY